MSIDPTEKISSFEINHLFLSFCTFCALLETKKINLANIFLLVLRDSKFRNLLKQYCDFKNDYDALKYYNEFEKITIHEVYDIDLYFLTL